MEDEVNKIIGNQVPWLADRTILLTHSGSRTYGTDNEDSDYDYRGVCIPPANYYLGLDHLEHYSRQDRDEDKPELDITVTELRSFVGSALKGTPNNIEILFVRPEDILYKDVYGFADELLSHREDFLSKKCWHRMVGYANSQLLGVVKSPICRKPIVEQYGYDTKQAMHAVRLLDACKEIFTDGTYSTYRSNHEWLKSIRRGSYSLEQIIGIINDLINEVKELAEKSTAVPELPDYAKVNKWVTELVGRALALGNIPFHTIMPNTPAEVSVNAARNAYQKMWKELRLEHEDLEEDDILKVMDNLETKHLGGKVMGSNGWYQKYVVNKADGTPMDPAAEYLVLRIDKDPAARRAARTYAMFCENEELSEDLLNHVDLYAELAHIDLKVPVKVSPNNKCVRAILKRQEVTEGQCPCVPQDEWNDDTMCPCKALRETGECHCGLFVKIE